MMTVYVVCSLRAHQQRDATLNQQPSEPQPAAEGGPATLQKEAAGNTDGDQQGSHDHLVNSMWLSHVLLSLNIHKFQLKFRFLYKWTGTVKIHNR